MTFVLALNVGSTSLKFGLYRVDGADCTPLESGEADGSDLRTIEPTVSSWARPDVVAHRVVHGGQKVRDHRVLDDAVMTDLEAAIALAPLHGPPALKGIHWAKTHFPATPQVACIDTAFHAQMPEVAKTYPFPESIRAAGLERYGFHGLSCASIVRQLGADIPKRLVIAHLGGGCSVTAVREGVSIDTTMGLTPTGGLMMSTRTGDIDPGALIYLMREQRLDADALEALVDRRSGLAGLSGVSGDLRILRTSSTAEARLAVRMFVASVAKGIAAMMTSLEGADLLVFTGGIGENDEATRSEVTAALSWAGVGGSCAVRVLRSGEDEEMARIASDLIGSSAIAHEPTR